MKKATISYNDLIQENVKQAFANSFLKVKEHSNFYFTKLELTAVIFLLINIIGSNIMMITLIRYTSDYFLLSELILSSFIIAFLVFGFFYLKQFKPWITGLKKQHEALKYERNLLRALIDNLPDSVYIKDSNSRIIVANEAQIKNMGFEKEADVINKDDYEMYAKEIADQYRQSDLKIFKTGIPELNKELSYVDENNQNHWVLTSKMPIKNDNGDIIGLAGIGKDITALKNAQESMQKDRNLLRTIIDNLPDIIYVKDLECKKIIANPADVRTCGFKNEEELLHKSDYDTFPKDIADAFYADDLFVLQSGLSILNREEFFIDTDQNKQWLLSSKIPVRNEQGAIIGLVGIGRDITKRKNLEIELTGAKEKVEAGSMAKSEFLANMSHEIRTPLNSVIGFSDLLMKSQMSDTQQQYISAVYHSANSLLDIINEILDFSKIEAGKLEIENIKTDIFEIGYNISDVISFQAYKKNLELLLNIAVDIPRFVWTDGIRLRQVLINLLGNAIKFTKQGEVELKVETIQVFSASKRKIRFSVRDTGIGISKDNLNKVFEAFSQEDASVTRKYGGSGLGLTISKRLINLMGGELLVESTPDIGSTFYFDLILETQEGEAVEWNYLHNFSNILIVDDNTNNRQILKGMLALKGIQCDEAENGVIALKKLESDHKYDVVLMDYHMPVMDGLTAIEQIRKKYTSKKLPVMLLHSSADDSAINEACRKFDVQQRLVKPIKIQHLFESLSKLEYDYKLSEIKENNITKKEKLSIDHFKVLVADDNDFNIMLISTIIQDILPNAQVIEASNGEQAVDCYKQNLPDIVFMDIQMPEMNGYDATKSIRNIEKLKRVPIIALTAAAVKDERDRCIGAGMNDYVSKPFVRDTIIETINKWLLV